MYQLGKHLDDISQLNKTLFVVNRNGQVTILMVPKVVWYQALELSVLFTPMKRGILLDGFSYAKSADGKIENDHFRGILLPAVSQRRI